MPSVGYIYPVEAAAPIVERRVAGPVLVPELLHLSPDLHLPQGPGNLLVRRSRLPHAPSPLWRSNLIHLRVVHRIEGGQITDAETAPPLADPVRGTVLSLLPPGGINRRKAVGVGSPQRRAWRRWRGSAGRWTTYPISSSRASAAPPRNRAPTSSSRARR